MLISASAGSVPPILGGLGGRGGNDKINVMDGGHRMTAARMRGDRTIYAIVTVGGPALKAAQGMIGD
jgi:ParB-like chromosome segregation protein Spo0J